MQKVNFVYVLRYIYLYRDVYRTLPQNAVLPAGTSIIAIGNVVRKDLNMSYDLAAVKVKSIP